jgi:putative transposase
MQTTVGQCYCTDLADSEWETITFIVFGDSPARQRRRSLRQIVNGLFYLLKEGCTWRGLPREFGPWQTVYYYFRQWRERGIIEQLHEHLRDRLRQQAGREHSPSMLLIDAQSVKTQYHGPERGFDGGKKIKGRKRHILTDTLGLIIAVMVTSAQRNDRDVARALLRQVRHRFERVQLVLADSGYRSKHLVRFSQQVLRARFEIVKSVPKGSGYQKQAKRWIIERTFGWLNNYHRLAKDREVLPDSSVAMIQLAMIRIMIKRCS